MSGDAGNVAVVVALVMTALLGAAALIVDTGAVLSRGATLQTGADAAAVAVARQCAEHAVDAAVGSCDLASASAIAAGFVRDNLPDAAEPALEPIAVSLSSSYGGDAGRVVVTARMIEDPAFSHVIGVAERTASARATARWGPLLGDDTAFPLTLCRGVDVAEGVVLDILLDPAADGDPEICTSEDELDPISWVEPDDGDPDECTRTVSLSPPTNLVSQRIDELPTDPGCPEAIDDLLTAIATDADADARTRVLPVTDRQFGGPSAGPAHALIAVEFDGLRLSDRHALRPGATWGDDSTACETDETVSCMLGTVVPWLPPADGPIADPALVGASSFDDTTVLHVRLVE